MNDVGYIQVHDPTTKTERARASSPRATRWTPIYRQAITAAGTGCRAAIDAERWLQELHD